MSGYPALFNSHGEVLVLLLVWLEEALTLLTIVNLSVVSAIRLQLAANLEAATNEFWKSVLTYPWESCISWGGGGGTLNCLNP